MFVQGDHGRNSAGSFAPAVGGNTSDSKHDTAMQQTKPIHHRPEGSTFAHTRGGVVITRYRVVQKTNLKKTKTKRPAASQGTRGGGGAPQRAAANRPGHRLPTRGVRRSPGVGGHASYHISLCLCLSTSRGWSNCVGNHDVDCQRDNQNSQVTTTSPLLSAVRPRKHAYILCFLTRLVSSFVSPHMLV